MNEPRSNAERLEELLADQALFGLSPEEREELTRLLSLSSTDAEIFERTAAIASLAYHPDTTLPLPEDLKQKVLDSYAAFASTSNAVDSPTFTSPAAPEFGGTRSPRAPGREMFAWFIAAASLAAVFIVWWTSQPGSPPAVSLAESRMKLLQGAPDAVRTDWTPTADQRAQGVAGDVVWSNALQQGFLRFKGLARNDAKQAQYQLWIFDGRQDARYPIDGGVFDVDDADVIVPINAKLRVVDPKMFAITVEKPGGVVVSDRAGLLLIAKVAAQGA